MLWAIPLVVLSGVISLVIWFEHLFEFDIESLELDLDKELCLV